MPVVNILILHGGLAHLCGGGLPKVGFNSINTKTNTHTVIVYDGDTGSFSAELDSWVTGHEY